MTGKQKIVLAFLLFATTSIGTGCAGHVGVSGSAHVYAPGPPTMAFIAPGVWVVEDYDEPVFYHDDYYWSYRYGMWYRSDVHTGGWVRVHVVPPYVLRIEHPSRYVRYRAPHAHKRRTVVAHKHHRSHPQVKHHRPVQSHRVHGHPSKNHGGYKSKSYPPPRRHEEYRKKNGHQQKRNDHHPQKSRKGHTRAKHHKH